MAEERSTPDPLPTLRDLFGNTVEFGDTGDAADSYRILAELVVGENRYALLQSEAMSGEDGFEIFRLTADDEGELQLETVEDDDEWELVAEAYDDTLFGNDEQP